MLTVGAFLDTLTPAQEDRVLTRVMITDWLYEGTTGDGCLIGVAFDCRTVRRANPELTVWEPIVYYWTARGLGNHFNTLCHRFGVARVTAAIRARILENRARRLLGAAQPREEAVWAR